MLALMVFDAVIEIKDAVTGDDNLGNYKDSKNVLSVIPYENPLNFSDLGENRTRTKSVTIIIPIDNDKINLTKLGSNTLLEEPVLLGKSCSKHIESISGIDLGITNYKTESTDFTTNYKITKPGVPLSTITNPNSWEDLFGRFTSIPI